MTLGSRLIRSIGERSARGLTLKSRTRPGKNILDSSQILLELERPASCKADNEGLLLGLVKLRITLQNMHSPAHFSNKSTQHFTHAVKFIGFLNCNEWPLEVLIHLEQIPHHSC